MSERKKQPAYQWYPGDARRDTALQSCRLVVRGLWREMLDLMHDGEPYGHLTAGGEPITDAQLARMVGESLSNVRRWLAELERKGVFSRTETGVIYSRRMVKDEHIRQVRKASGSKGGNPALLDNQPDNQPPKQADKQKPTPAVAVAVASAEQHLSPSSLPHAEAPPIAGMVAGPIAQLAIALTATANRAIAERWGEQVNVLMHSAPASHEAAERVLTANIDAELARRSIAGQCVRSKKARPPSTLTYFVPGILEDAERERAREQARASPDVAPLTESQQSSIPRIGRKLTIGEEVFARANGGRT